MLSEYSHGWPERKADWAAAVTRLLSDRARREELIVRGAQRALGYTWERTASLTHALYVEALSTRSRP